MFSIYLLDSSKLFQWDLNRKIKIIGKEDVDEVHFSHVGDEEALVVKPIKENNILIANIPNILLQESKDIFIYLVYKDKTLKKTFFTVGRREKPADYLYTEIDILNYSNLEKRLVELEEKLNDIPEVKPKVQSDWNQNDEMQSDYIKSRPFYHSPSSPFIEYGSENAIESIGKVNTPILIQDLSKTNQNTITNIINPNVLEDTWEKGETSFTGYNFIGKVEMYWKKYGVRISTSLLSGDSLKNNYTLSFIDDYNFEYIFNANFKFTFITKLSTLDEANKILYPTVGVYITGLDTDEDGVIVTYVSAGVAYTNTLNEVFLKSNIARKPWVEKELINKISSPLTASIGQVLEVEEVDENGKPIKWKCSDVTAGEEVDLSEYVKNTDYATSSKAGIVKPAYGLITSGQNLYIQKATTSQINEKKSGYNPLTPMDLDYAVKVGMATNTLEWTEEEKQSARDLIGASDSGVEITDGEPTKENTVLTVNPNAEEVSLYTAPEIDAMLQNLPSGSGGDAIIDVIELPTENIKENSFYRLLTGKLVFNQDIQNMYKCYCVETLPEVGEPATNIEQTEGSAYYNFTDGELYGYVDDILSMELSISIGWYAVSILFDALGYDYNGVINDIMDDPCDDAFRFLLEYEIYSYKEDKWTSHKVIGKAGTGLSAEVFNHHFNEAIGAYSHAEGAYSHAEGFASHAEGVDSHAEGDCSHAEGECSHAEGICSHAEGECSHAEGDSSHAEGAYSHAEGFASHAEGYMTHAEGAHSHAEGDMTYAEGGSSHAEGYSSHAEGDSSHAEGFGHFLQYDISGEANTTTYTFESSSDLSDFIIGASVRYSVNGNTYNTAKIINIDKDNLTITLNRTLSEDTALNNELVSIYVSGMALGDNSHSEGNETIAAGRSQHTQGEYNIVDPEYDVDNNSKRGKYAHIVGNGSSHTERSNAHTLDWSGNAEYQGDVVANACGGENPISLVETWEKVNNIPQPDWNQNDENASDYIKNRPFYGEECVVFDEEVTFVDGTYKGKINLDFKFRYKVIINDEICTENGQIIYDDPDYYMPVYLKDGSRMDFYSNGWVGYNDVNSTYSVKIIDITNSVLQKIDEKYIPSTIARTGALSKISEDKQDKNVIVNITKTVTDGTTTYSADKTFAEIETAIAEGKEVIAKFNATYLHMVQHNVGTNMYFHMFNRGNIMSVFYEITKNDNVNVYIDYIQGTSNKVNVLDTDSTDTQYPSAKAVVDYVNAMFGSYATDVANLIGGIEE